MKRYIFYSLLVCVCLVSCQNKKTVAPFLPSAADEECKQWVDSVMSVLDIQEKLSQIIVTTVPAVVNEETQELVRELAEVYKIGGILFSEGTPEEQVTLTNLANRYSKVPMLVTFDGEWGLSMRLTGTPDYPRNAALGCIQDVQLIEEYGREVARQFRELGVHVNFAPVVDVNTNPANPVIHVRSFGENAKEVAQRMLAYSRGLESGGVLSVCKHFPGHGDTDTDSHKTLPLVQYERSRLDSIELLPFREMVHAGLGGVMVGHLQVPALVPDGTTPTSLSYHVVTELLKKELGFQGLVFTDALDMKGVSEEPQVTLKALKAGNDMLLVQYNTKNALAELVEALHSGQLSEDDINEKCRKVLTYKYLLGIRASHPILKAEGVSERINTSYANELAAKLRRSAVTVLNGDAFEVQDNMDSVAILTIAKDEQSDSLFKAIIKGQEEIYLPWGADESTKQEIKGKLLKHKNVIVTILDAPKKIDMKDLDFLSNIKWNQTPLYVCFSSYRTLQSMQQILGKSCVVLAHSAEQDLQQYVARLLVGMERANGRLSMSIGEDFPVGSGCDFPVMQVKK